MFHRSRINTRGRFQQRLLDILLLSAWIITALDSNPSVSTVVRRIIRHEIATGRMLEAGNGKRSKVNATTARGCVTPVR